MSFGRPPSEFHKLRLNQARGGAAACAEAVAHHGTAATEACPPRPARSEDQASPVRVVQAEQAIFTSLRSAMGEGYRLVAMSPGIPAEERAEITRRSPSVGSVCSTDPAATALASYTLATQRHCVAWTRYAGKEHTARGGNRVHTHLVVIEPAGLAAFAWDPFRVQAALAANIGDAPNIRPNLCLPTLELPVEPALSADAAEVSEAVLRHACRLAQEVLSGPAILALASQPLEVLRWMFAFLPAARRAGVNCSGNLQYAASRELQLTCADVLTPEVRRAIQGRDLHVLDLEATSSSGPGSGWFDWVRERRQQRRLDEVCLLASQIVGRVEPACLDRLAAVGRDADRVETATHAELEKLVNHYGQLQPPYPVEQQMVRHLLSAAVRRSAVLQHAAH